MGTLISPRQDQTQAAQLLDHQCSYCYAARTPTTSPTSPSRNLYMCAGCKVVRYCSREHQIAHWSRHKPDCLPIKRAKATALAEERKIKMNPASFKGKNGAQEGWEAFYMPGDPFEHEIDFWGWDSTRVYMRARFHLVDALRRIKTTEALQWALGHAIGVLQLNRSDALGVRYMVPAMMVRLGNDQEAYDFLKWWATSGRGKEYDWGDPHAPYLQLRGEDVLEDVVLWTVKEAALADQVVVLLIKLRLLVALERQIELLKGRISAGESWATKRDLSGKTAGRGEVEDVVDMEVFDSMARKSELLSAQVRSLISAVQSSNGHFLKMLVSEQKPSVLTHRESPMQGWSTGSREEISTMLQYTYDAWTETPMAVERLRDHLDQENIT